MSRRSLLAVLILILLGTGLHLVTQADMVPVAISGGAEPPAAPADKDPVVDWEPASPRVTGRVLDAGGRPVAGAEVRFTLDRKSRLFEELSPAEQQQTHRVRSDAHGAFQIDTLRLGAPYDVVVVRRGFATLLTYFSSRAVGVTTELRLVLRPGKTVRGLVLDGRGQPVEGLQVWLHRSTRAGIFFAVSPLVKTWPDSDLYHAATGPDGRFEVTDLPEHPLDLAIWGSTFAPLFRRGILLPADQEVADLGSFRLQPGVTLVGRVTDLQGTPIPGAVIGSPDQDEPVTESGRDGRFVIEGLSPGAKLYLSVCRSGYQTVSRWFAASAPEAERVVLEPAARIAGQVVAADGAPVAGAEVRASIDGSSRSWSSTAASCQPSDFARGTTDARGRFELEGLSPGAVHLQVMAAGHPVEILSLVAGASTSRLTVQLRPGAVLTGRITDAAGRPVAGARISDGDHPRTVSRSDGTYRLEGVGAGARSIAISHPNYRHTAKTLRIEPGDNRFDPSLSRLPRVPVRGRVLGPEGQPLAGARVAVDGHIAAATASDGSFALLLENGSYSFDSQLGDLGPPAWQSVEVADRPVDGVEIRLLRGITLSGRILGITQEELADASVSAIQQEGAAPLSDVFRESAVDATGRYRLRGLTPGEWSIFVYTGRRDGSAPLVLAAGDEERALDVGLATAPPAIREPAEQDAAQRPQGINLRGRLLGVEPADLKDVSIDAHLDHRWESGTVTRSGEYRLPDLPPGTWEVLARHGIDTATGTVRLEPGMDEAVLDLTFEPGDLTLTGHIPAAPNLPSLYLELGWEDGIFQHVRTTADEKGDFRFTRLHPGRYHLTVHDDSGILPRGWTIEMSADREMVLSLGPAAGTTPAPPRPGAASPP